MGLKYPMELGGIEIETRVRSGGTFITVKWNGREARMKVIDMDYSEWLFVAQLEQNKIRLWSLQNGKWREIDTIIFGVIKSVAVMGASLLMHTMDGKMLQWCNGQMEHIASITAMTKKNGVLCVIIGDQIITIE